MYKVKRMGPVVTILLGLITLAQASTLKVFAVETPRSSTLRNVTETEVLPMAEKMTLSEYFHERMRLLSQGQVHQRHTLLTPAELARDFNNWDSESDELETTNFYQPVRRRRPGLISRVQTPSIPTTTTTTSATPTSTTTTEASIPQPQRPKKPLPNAIYSSSLHDIMMSRQPVQSVSSSFGSRRVIPINWEEELTEWDEPVRRHHGSAPGRDPVIFEGGGGGLDPSFMNRKLEYTHASSFRRKRPKFDPTSNFFSVERRPEEFEGSFAPSHTQRDVPSRRRFENFDVDEIDFGADPADSGRHHPNFGNDAFSYDDPPTSSGGLRRDFGTEFALNDHSSHDHLNKKFESAPIEFGDNPSTFGSSFRNFDHDEQPTLEDPHKSNHYIEFDSNEPPPNSGGIIHHASPELRWEDGTLVDTKNKKFEKLGVHPSEHSRTQGPGSFLGPVQFGSLEFGKGINHKDYKDPTQNFDITGDKPTVHHPPLEKSTNELKQDSDIKRYPNFRHSMETIIMPWDANDKDGLEKKIEEGYHYNYEKNNKNSKDDSSQQKGSTVFYLSDENKSVGTEDTFLKDNPKVTVIYGPLIEDDEIEKEKTEEKKNSDEVKIKDLTQDQSNKSTSKEKLSHHQVDVHVKPKSQEEDIEYKYPDKHENDDRYKNHRYDPSSEQREKNADEKRSRPSEKTYHNISEDRENGRKKSREHLTSGSAENRQKPSRKYDIADNQEDGREQSRKYDISGDKEDRKKLNRNYDISIYKEDGREQSRKYDIAGDKEDRRKLNSNYDISIDKEDGHKLSGEYDISENKESGRKKNRNYDASGNEEDRRKQSWEYSTKDRSGDSKENFNPYKGFKLHDHFPKSYDPKGIDANKEAMLRPASRYESREIAAGEITSVETPYYSSKFPSKSTGDAASRRSSSKFPGRGSRDPEVDDLSVHHIAGPPYHDAIPLDVVKALSHERGPKVVTKINSRERPKAQSSYESIVDDFDHGSIFRYDERSRSPEKDKSILVPLGASREAKDPYMQNKESKKKPPGGKHFGEVVEIFPDHVDYKPPKLKQINTFDEVVYDLNDDEFYHDIDPNKKDFDVTQDKKTDSKIFLGDDFEDDFGRPPTFDFSFSKERFNDPFFEDLDRDYSSEDRNIGKHRPTLPYFKHRRRRRFPRRQRAKDYGRPRPSTDRASKPPSHPQLSTPSLRIPERTHKMNGLEIYRVPTSARNKDLIAIKINEFAGNEATSHSSTPKFGQRLSHETRTSRPISSFPRTKRLQRGRRRGPSLSSRFFGSFNNNIRRTLQEDNTDMGPNPSSSDPNADHSSYNYDYNPGVDGGLQVDKSTSLSMPNAANSYGWDDRNTRGGDRMTDDGGGATGRRNDGQWSIGGLVDLTIPSDISKNVHRMFG